MAETDADSQLLSRRNVGELPLSGVPPGRITYLVDFDSTINDFDRRFLNTINEQFDTEYQLKDWTEWNIGPAMNMDEAHEKYGWGVWDTQGFTRSLRPVAGALSALWRLQDSGGRVIVCSSRPPHHGQWLRDWFDDYGLRDLEVWVERDKLRFGREQGVTVSFDDSGEHIVALSELGKVYAMDRPWNQGIIGPNIIRVPSLYLAVEDLGLFGNDPLLYQ